MSFSPQCSVRLLLVLIANLGPHRAAVCRQMTVWMSATLFSNNDVKIICVSCPVKNNQQFTMWKDSNVNKQVLKAAFRTISAISLIFYLVFISYSSQDIRLTGVAGDKEAFIYSCLKYPFMSWVEIWRKKTNHFKEFLKTNLWIQSRLSKFMGKQNRILVWKREDVNNIGRPPKKRKKNHNSCELWGGQQILVCEPQKSVF